MHKRMKEIAEQGDDTEEITGSPTDLEEYLGGLDLADVESVRDKASIEPQDLDDWYKGEDEDQDLSSGHIWSLRCSLSVNDGIGWCRGCTFPHTSPL